MRRVLWIHMVLLSVVLLAGGGRQAQAGFTVEVRDQDGHPVNGFRWLVEEDTTYDVSPGVPVADSPSVSIHKSYSPVVAKGLSVTSGAVVSVPSDKRYFVSVLPFDGHSMSGHAVKVGQTSVEVVVQKLPLPTSQITVFAFADTQPLNGAPDIPAEVGLAGFKVILADGGGQVMTNAYGHMIGTVYQTNPDGSYKLDNEGVPMMQMAGSGFVLTNANGEAVIKDLPMGKYGVQVIPPSGSGWMMTASIEGTHTNDAWVAAGEPPYFAEWGFFQWHVFFPFVKATEFPLPGEGQQTGAVRGQVVYAHASRPPLAPGLSPGIAVRDAMVSLNFLDGNDEMVYTGPCNPVTGEFTIENVPPGNYQLAIWDLNLLAIIDFRTVNVAAGGTVEMGKVPVYAWFGMYEGYVYTDANENGIRESGEVGIRNQAVNLRFPDGSIYAAQGTDPMGYYVFENVFPFFFYLVAEVDFARYKATGAYVVVDDGGALPYDGARNTPQPQPENGGLGYRVQTGEVLTQAMLLYAGQINQTDWGKTGYGEGENGGISGIVHYAVTRAENDPRWAAAEDWEPGIPRVQVNLYTAFDADRQIDDRDGSDDVTLADVDNYPFGWAGGGAMGPEDVDWNSNGTFDMGDALQVTWTDSWDDAPPTGAVAAPQFVHGIQIQDGAETQATWNQIRPGVFDGGYAFGDLSPGYYIVEAVAPPGYEHVKEEDKNVDFGDTYGMSLAALPAPYDPPAECVGDLHTVPSELTLFPGVAAPYAGQQRRLPDRKWVGLAGGENTACDFFMFTEVPKAARIWGLCFNDVVLAFDPADPNKGTNFGVSWLPISIQDAWGNEISRIYTDEWGHYNALVPSTYTVNVPSPSGVAPNILKIHLNHPGPIPDPNNPGRSIIDPFYDPAYGQIATQWDFWPGKTTRLDTPILPIGAMRSSSQHLDCMPGGGTPIVAGVDGGPYIPAAGVEITIRSVGMYTVVNSDGQVVLRDYTFGTVAGEVTVGGVALMDVEWSAGVIRGTLPSGAAGGQIVVSRGDTLKVSPVSLTLHVGGGVTYVAPGERIQAAIDDANDGDLIVVRPGVYKENVIVSKPIRLQGSGAFNTLLLAGPLTPGEQASWDQKVADLEASGDIGLIPGERPDFFLERGPAILVASRAGRFGAGAAARIDGFDITGAISGGGIYVHAYAENLQITNNRIRSNEGNFGGGIRVGTPSLVNATGDGYYSSENSGLRIRYNLIATNGAVDGGGGIAIFNGADGYEVSDNRICGNFSLLYGGGLAHFGLSPNGLIARNVILNNESFDEGGGIMVAGELIPGGAPAGTLSPGAGAVRIVNNLVQGNLSGDDGGGIRALTVNGQDVSSAPSDPTQWYALQITGNLIVNNVSADAGGGISLDDAARVFIVNNTVAHNDSTATSADAFGGALPATVDPGQWGLDEAFEGGQGGLTDSVPQAAGIVARAHSLGLRIAFGAGYEQEFANPALEDNIIWQNRSFRWDASYNGGFGGLRPSLADGEMPVYWDLAVYGTVAPEQFDPRSSILTDIAGYHGSNSSSDPLLASPYVNEFRATSGGAALGNFVTVAFTPLGAAGDYHIGGASPAVSFGAGNFLTLLPGLEVDIDGQGRPSGAAVDAGADEAVAVVPLPAVPPPANAKKIKSPTNKGAGPVATKDAGSVTEGPAAPTAMKGSVKSAPTAEEPAQGAKATDGAAAIRKTESSTLAGRRK